MNLFNKDEAVSFFESNVWKDWSSVQLAEFQLSQELLCIDLDVYHQSLEEALGRPVLNLEMRDRQKLRAELFTKHPELLNLPK